MTEECDPAHAMAVDAALLDAAEGGEPSIRLYRWSGLSVTLGRFQQPAGALIDPDGTSWAYRPTGGGAVLHGHDVTLSAAVPLELFKQGTRPNVRAIYRSLAQIAIDFLTSAGVKAWIAEDLSPDAMRSRSESCFATVSKNDLVDAEGRKICGCALRVTRLAALIQTSIPVASPIVNPGTIINGATAPNFVLGSVVDAIAPTIGFL